MAMRVPSSRIVRARGYLHSAVLNLETANGFLPKRHPEAKELDELIRRANELHSRISEEAHHADA